MPEHCVILVDAGYLLAAGGTRVAGTSLRSAVRVDHAAIIAAIRDLAETDSGLEALRLYWYDASRDGLMDETHKRIARLPGVKVRLGRISYNGDQKGVDLKLGLDLVGVARNKAATIAYLVSGDDDLAEAVEAAQELGMRVVVMGVENRDHRLGVQAVAEDLVLKADRLLCLPGEASDAAFTPAVRPAAALPVAAGDPAAGPERVPADDSVGGQAGTGGPVPAPPKPTPRPFPGHAPSPAVPYLPGPHLPAPHLPAPHLPAPARTLQGSQLVYRSAPRPAGTPEASPLLDAAHEVGRAVAESWYASITQAELNSVVADRPVLPVEIDRVLLRDCARRIGEADTDLQSVRRELREAFWEKLDQLN